MQSSGDCLLWDYKSWLGSSGVFRDISYYFTFWSLWDVSLPTHVLTLENAVSINNYFSSSLYGFLVFGMMLSRAEAQTLADVFELCINQKIILSLLVFYTQPNPTLWLPCIVGIVGCKSCPWLSHRWGYFEEEKNTTRKTFFYEFLFIYLIFMSFIMFFFFTPKRSWGIHNIMAFILFEMTLGRGMKYS